MKYNKSNFQVIGRFFNQRFNPKKCTQTLKHAQINPHRGKTNVSQNVHTQNLN